MKKSQIREITLASAAAVIVIAFATMMISHHSDMRPNAPMPRYVSVSGDGTVKVAPDSVRVDASISNIASTSSASLSATAKAAETLRKSLTASGVEAKYISSVNLSTNPEYSYSNNGPAKIIGYRSTQNFTITIRDAKNSGLIIQNVQNQVGNNLSINSTSPYIYDQKVAEASARALAVEAAKAKAQTYAGLTNSKLGKVLSVEEQISQSGPVPMMAMAKSVGADAPPVQVDLGQQNITVTVTTKWELR